MIDFTPPGYLVQVAVYAGFYGLAAMACPPNEGRRLALPGGLVLAELARWSWPFGGVPLSTFAMSQADSPLAPQFAPSAASSSWDWSPRSGSVSPP